MPELAMQLIREAKEKRSTFLDLGNCGLTDIPEELFELEWLEELNLGWYYLNLQTNQFKESQNKDARNSIKNISEKIKTLQRLKALYLSDNKLTDVSQLNNLPSLSVLHLHNNQIRDIDELKELPSLSRLYLSNNKIADISPLKELASLSELYLSHNKIADIRPLKELAILSVLYLSHNQITDISPLEGLRSLSVLYSSDNKITNVSPLNQLTSLTKLYLYNNKIADISPLKELTALTKLNLYNNRITDISPLKNIIERGIPVKWKNDFSYSIILEGNPLTSPPPEIVKQGNEAVLNYFKELKQQGSEYLHEAKLLIIGEGGAGKTTLARKIIDETAPLPEEEETTKGISIESYHFTTQNGKDFQVNIWDFGGQEIYHATHQFFLTKRSLYVLVDDTRKDDKSVNDPIFNYWLQMAGLYGGGSPLLIVQNEKGDRTKELDMKGMMGHFDFIKDRISIDLAKVMKTGDLEKVRSAIHLYIQQLPHVGEELPKNWVSVRKELEELAKTRDYISLEDYLSICAKHAIKEEERALLLSSYLHDLGSFLHFQDDFNLRNIFILNNQWATDAVYKVLDNEKIKNKYGHFSRSDLDEIWSEPKYKFRQQELLNLMMKFELCYELKDAAKITWLAPQLLSLKAPDMVWDNKNNLIVRYTYDFMPKGLLSRFIVRMQQYIKEPSLSWKSGVVLERQGTKALVTETYGSREIVINVKGSSKIFSKELTTLIVEDFDKMHERFENLKVKKLIPCNCRECQTLEKPYSYEYQNLIRRREKGIKTTQCEISFEDVDVIGLLDGVFIPKEKFTENGTLKVFISYSRHDNEIKNKFLKQLSSLKRTNQIITWNDADLVPSEDWDERIKKELVSSNIILLLVSDNFIATDYIWNTELEKAYERVENKEKVAVVPIITDFCRWENLPFARFNVLPDKGVPVTDKNKWVNENQAWTQVILGIEKVINDLSKR